MTDKNELKKQYKQTAQPMGVFQIRNLANEKIFISKSKNLKSAFNSNMFQLKKIQPHDEKGYNKRKKEI